MILFGNRISKLASKCLSHPIHPCFPKERLYITLRNSHSSSCYEPLIPEEVSSLLHQIALTIIHLNNWFLLKISSLLSMICPVIKLSNKTLYCLIIFKEAKLFKDQDK